MPSRMQGTGNSSAPLAPSGRMNSSPRGEMGHNNSGGTLTEHRHERIGTSGIHNERPTHAASEKPGRMENRRNSGFENRASRHNNVSNTERAASHYRGGAPNYGRDARGFGKRPSYWKDRPRHFDKSVYQHNFKAENRFHYGHYQRPGGWYYRRWTFGERLPVVFWARDYWLTDWWLFELPIPPYGYVWVRYGDDAILINTYTGEILEVEYDVFY